ncbi:Glycosyl hydrolases family 39 [Flavobacterium fryxellicola]|uniref:Glycoside hydrolase family 42 N-terminal domain-containing protein n=1 Tax=Flavobacterium fryxellicola TaxID=249352 RepID=A0A167U832_9FLAO|nr:hypothetical protein [Flavobacterium fryxellicola]OAB25346.1 hypothetical protein FBFR_15295 [Flavobacterium fryxellicola]SHN74984.1 Glycosyl hydrolases family 39 [Flavobacterium fryxellicola]
MSLVKQLIIIVLTFLTFGCSQAQNAEIKYPLLGKIKSRNVKDIKASNWIIGCETLDRDYANYDSYKDYLAPLGIKRIRVQTGWAKTETVKGVYDWSWLDHIVNDATKKGLQPWLQLSYGNSIYEGGGGVNLSAGIPKSEEALKAWDNWVTAMVKRYKNKVVEWEVWNEPNFGDNTINSAKITAELNIRTAEIIKKIQPESKISGLAMGHIDLDFAEDFFEIIASQKKMHLFDNMVYHDYVYNPDSNYDKVEKLKSLLHKYAPKMTLRQGENGAPSKGGSNRGAIGDHDWSEISQAKWNTRRMLGDLGHDVENSLFTIIDIAYTGGPITKLNVKGIIESDSTKKAIRLKMAYYAAQNVASVFDNTLERIEEVKETHNRNYVPENPLHLAITKSTDRRFEVYAYQNKESKQQLFTIWESEGIPSNSLDKKTFDFTIANANISDPVYVDIITGSIYQIPKDQWSVKNAVYTFKNIPIYDSPILIADKSLIQLNPTN